MRARRGFTLLEVVVALALGATVVLGARALFGVLGASGERIARESAAADERANGERLLRSLLWQAETGVHGDGFRGDDSSLHFSTWCRAARGWTERCRIDLGVATLGRDAVVTAILPHGDTLLLWRGRAPAGLRYLDATNGGDRWVPEWGSDLTLPAAVAIVSGGDTLVFLAGGRP
jgi:prepilin-type N-terminal cleavage/methylation domain-containing protein